MHKMFHKCNVSSQTSIETQKTLISEYQADLLFSQLLRQTKDLFEIRNGFYSAGLDCLYIVDRPKSSCCTPRSRHCELDPFEKPRPWIHYRKNMWKLVKIICTVSNMQTNQIPEPQAIQSTPTNRTSRIQVRCNHYGFFLPFPERKKGTAEF